ncbi:MAG: hypothetical protein AAF215_00700 [Cyanobacteria bacterium P01_A01_bin.123]
MGNISAHAEINEYVINELQKISPNEDYAYLELGNFLTDVSQFRDPYAHIKGKKTVLKTASEEEIFLKILLPIPILGFIPSSYLKGWLDDLLGKAENGKEHGALAQFFYHMSHFVTHQLFAEDSPTHVAQPFVGLLPGAFNVKPIQVDEVDRVFQWAFTQYYPHEHLDMPPFQDGPHHRHHHDYQIGRRGLINYLEEHINYIIEELTKIEYAWVLRRKLPPHHPDRRDLLVRLGHVIHAIEDYYFHSNFVEVRQWWKTNSYHHSRNPSQSQKDYDFISRKALDIDLKPGYATRLIRRFSRRLRYPTLDRNVEGSTKVSEDATNLIYTGGFSQTDISHTLYGALHSIEETFDKTIKSAQAIGGKTQDWISLLRQLVLIDMLFNEEERRKVYKNEDYKQRKLEKHQEQVEKGTYHVILQVAEQRKLITPKGGKALIKAFEVDRQFESDYKLAPGVGGFIILFLANLQKQVDKSQLIVNRLDKDIKSISNKATDNDASSEMIGTHSLMAKDDFEKDPLRNEAIALAKVASASLSALLLRRVKDNPDPNQGIHWDVLVRYYMRFPTPLPGFWEEDVLRYWQRTNKVPKLSDIKKNPNVAMLTANNPKGKLQVTRNGQKREKLEQRYKNLEKIADK